MRPVKLPFPAVLVFLSLPLVAACGGGGGSPVSAGSAAPPAPSAPPAAIPAIADDVSLYRLVTQTEPFSAYAAFPDAEEFTTGRLDGSEAHRPLVRVTLNARAMSALVGGRLPAGARFPDGSVVFKEIRANQQASPGVYAVMYREQANPLAGDGWLWAEFNPNGTVGYSITQRGSGCIFCHRRGLGPQNDLVRTFERQR